MRKNSALGEKVICEGGGLFESVQWGGPSFFFIDGDAGGSACPLGDTILRRIRVIMSTKPT